MDSTAPAPDAAATRAAFRNVFPGVMVAMFLAAIDQTILATALPAMATAFGQLADLSWVAIAYLLAATVTAPIHGHLGDRFGRRRVLLAALGLFVLASVGCALSSSLWMLVAMRALQGAGGGGLMTLSQALIGENVPPRERARFQGYFAAMYALSSTLGPVMGGYLTEQFSWRSIFYVNLPLGALAAYLAWRIPTVMRPPPPRFRFDFFGAVLFGLSAVALLFALASGGHRIPWASPAMLALVAAALVGFAVLAWWELRIDDPVIPVRLLATPAILRSNLLVMCFAASLFSSVLYLPLYLQLGRAAGIGESGLWLLPITLAISAGAMLSGRLISRTGRLTIYPISGLLLSGVAFGTLAATIHVASVTMVVALMMTAALGLGCVMPACQIIVQDTAGRSALGAATASISVSRSIGGATGVALAGALLFVVLGPHEGVAGAMQALPGAAGGGADAAQALVRTATRERFDTAFRGVFIALTAVSFGGAAIAFTIPRKRL